MKLQEEEMKHTESDTGNVTAQNRARQLQAATRDGDSCEVGA